MLRTLDNCNVIQAYGKPAQSNGVCEGVIIDGELHTKCKTCSLHDASIARKICTECGKEFYSLHPYAKVCSKRCKLLRAKKNKKRRKSNKKHTFDDTLREIAEYNQKNGTFLTYGKYKAMKFLEQQKGANLK